MDELLRHPLLLLAAGAMLTGLLVPSITRRWQDRQKELEVKTGLVAEMSETFMTIVLEIQFVRVRRELRQAGLLAESAEEVAARQAKFDDAYHAWEVKSAVTEAKLQAYFPGSDIPEEWVRVSEAVTNLYALEGQGDQDREASMKRLAEAFDVHNGPPSWAALRSGILAAETRLLRQIVEQPVYGFRSRLLRWSR